jgi:predicted dehydrogenase
MEAKRSAQAIPVAVIGLGRIASLLEDDVLREKPCSHAGAVAANPDCVLIAGCDIDHERRAKFAARWHVPVYANAEEMLADSRSNPPGILIIATYPDSHAPYAELGAKAGVGVIICEKPLADSLKSARKISRLAETGGKNNLRIVVNHERRYSADYIRARSIIESGELGELLSVKGRLAMGRTRPLLKVLWDDGTHLADAIMFLSGRRLVHKGLFGDDVKGTRGTTFLEGMLENTDGCKTAGIPCVIEAQAGREALIFEIDLSFARGRIRIGNGIWEIWKTVPCPYAEGFTSLEKTAEGWEGPTGYFAGMLADAVRCYRNPQARPASCADDALAVVEWLLSIR